MFHIVYHPLPVGPTPTGGKWCIVVQIQFHVGGEKGFSVLVPFSSLTYPYASISPALLSLPCSPAPCPGVEMKSLLLAATFLIDYLHFEADPGDSDDEDD